MNTNRPILFNHIPKTGGTTLRIILNRIYGEEKVYFIESMDVSGSLDRFKKLSPEKRERYTVIAGHGAEYFSQFVDNPFRITILRDPVSLFISQYHYLKTSPNSVFRNEVSVLNSIEDYMDFAIKNGQDNLLTRYLSNSVTWLIDPSMPIPELELEGTILVELAKQNLSNYDLAFDLNLFDDGIFALKKKLDWKHIPLYKPYNKTNYDSGQSISKDLSEKIRHFLRFDIELYHFFNQTSSGSDWQVDKNKSGFKIFNLRQKLINKLFD